MAVRDQGAFIEYRHRRQLFATTPMIFTAVEQRRVQVSSLRKMTPSSRSRTTCQPSSRIFSSCCQIPKPSPWSTATRPVKESGRRAFAKSLHRSQTGFRSIWYNDRSFADILKRAAALPPHSAIFWHLMNVDAAGVVHDGDTALPRLYAVANAPMFTYDGAYFGREIVGGPMHSVRNLSQLAADVAARILGGEKAGDIKVPASRFAPPIYDWRLLQRWDISESRLPPGSEVYFRQPTIWQQYFWTMMAIIAALAMQAWLIVALVWEARRRRRLEATERAP
jgi:hypothetical protein